MITDPLRGALELAASAPMLLVASDYDGVLAPIVDDPSSAFPDPDALTALQALARLPDTGVIAVSGRSLDVLARLSGAPTGVTLIGTHGAEEAGWEVDPETAARVATLRRDLEDLTRRFPGAEVEVKPIGVAFHYRHTSDPGPARSAAEEIGAAAGAKIIPGKMVVECVLAEANKGTAVLRARDRIAADVVVYLGDDTTDEDAFAVLDIDDVGLKVGGGDTLARYRVASQTDVAPVLELLASYRARASR